VTIFYRNCWKWLPSAIKHALQQVNKIYNTFLSSSSKTGANIHVISSCRAVAVWRLFLCTLPVVRLFLTSFHTHDCVGSLPDGHLWMNAWTHFLEVVFLTIDLTMKTYCWIIYFIEKVINSDCKIDRYGKVECSHTIILISLCLSASQITHYHTEKLHSDQWQNMCCLQCC
jgi:hypothetical protein